jgi:hypothetical protein
MELLRSFSLICTHTYPVESFFFSLSCTHTYPVESFFPQFEWKLLLFLHFYSDNLKSLEQGSYIHHFCRVRSEDYGVMGIRYGSENLSIGASFVPFPCMHLFTAHIFYPNMIYDDI